MQEHEVPTHLQAEDKVLLGLTFPQIVAACAVCATAYGVYRYAPFGPYEVRIAAAVLFAAGGIALVAGRLGGRRLPLIAADLLKYRLGARRFVGPPAEIVRAVDPAPPRSKGGLPALFSRAVRRTRIALRRRRRRTKGGRRTVLRPRQWFRRRNARRYEDGDGANGPPSKNDVKRKKPRAPWRSFFAMAVVAAFAFSAAAPAALADGGEEGVDDETELTGWTSPEIDFQPPPPVEGRRLFVERLEILEDRAIVDLRAAAGIDLAARTFSGTDRSLPIHHASARLEQGELSTYETPVGGPSPSMVFSWRDDLGFGGALALKGDQIPHPLPEMEGDLCDLRLLWLKWTPGTVEGAVESRCVQRIEETFDVTVVTGHASVELKSVMDAEVDAVAGRLAVEGGGAHERFPFIPDGETRFNLPADSTSRTLDLTIEAVLRASLSVPMPPAVHLTHHPERIEMVTGTVPVLCPGTSRVVEEVVELKLPEGEILEHEVSRTLTVPETERDETVTLPYLHEEHVRAEVSERSPERRTRDEEIVAEVTIGTDDPFEVFAPPPPPPPPDISRQAPAGPGLLGGWFGTLGWDWPWR